MGDHGMMGTTLEWGVGGGFRGPDHGCLCFKDEGDSGA